MKTPKKTKKQPLGNTEAMHALSGDGKHAVGIWDLHVHIVRDGDGWFAQGLEIDYGVQGDTVEEAKHNFEIGLEGTIDLHLKMEGDINGFLKFAPMAAIQEALQSRLNGAIKTYSQVSLHDGVKRLPYDGISYLVAA